MGFFLLSFIDSSVGNLQTVTQKMDHFLYITGNYGVWFFFDNLLNNINNLEPIRVID